MILLQQFSNKCWICGARGPLTGEHKVKKTDLKLHPTMVPKFLVRIGGKPAPIQGLNSKQLKFLPSICARCNNSTTQKADRSYELFRREESEIARTTIDELIGIDDWTIEREVDFSARTDLGRYFGKHLGCSLANNKFPIPLRLSAFVGGRSDMVCVTVTTRVAPFWFQDETGGLGPLNALGGSLIIMSDDDVHFPAAYQTAYMTDGVQFIVKMPLSQLEAFELIFFYHQSLERVLCNPSDDERKYRGLPYDE